MSIQSRTSSVRFVSGGICSLFIAMGVGRFAYTPLLPDMQIRFGFSDVSAGLIASLNFAGYLLGAIMCRKSLTPKMRLWGFRWAMILSIITTLGMGILDGIAPWMVLRFLAGIASAGVFVLGSAIVIDELHQCNPSAPTMLIYSGVGLGIAFSGLTTPVLVEASGVQNAWVATALLCLPLAWWSWVTLVPHAHVICHPAIKDNSMGTNRSNMLIWLLAAYFCEGFGYIVSGTFLVSFLQNTSDVNSSATAAWVIVGLAASASVPIFQFMSRRWGPVRVLIIAHGLQAMGIALPVVSNHWFAVNAGALLFGATFMGIVALSLLMGKTIRPDQSHTIIGLLTAVYGVGQILGPLISGVLSTHSGNFKSSLGLSSAMVALGGMLLFIGRVRSIYFHPDKPENEKEESNAVR